MVAYLQCCIVDRVPKQHKSIKHAIFHVANKQINYNSHGIYKKKKKLVTYWTVDDESSFVICVAARLTASIARKPRLVGLAVEVETLYMDS